MVYSTCNTCGHGFHWEWIEAFSKFGFSDGDGQIETWDVVAEFLEESGYSIDIGKWGLHNTLIVSLKNNGVEFIPSVNSGYCLGYNNPRDYLPEKIIKILDNAFPQTSEYNFP